MVLRVFHAYNMCHCRNSLKMFCGKLGHSSLVNEKVVVLVKK